jgi:hypothetical protein
MRYAFGDFVLDPDRYELARQGRLVPVEPQVFAVLHHLVRHHDRMIGKEELLNEVWRTRAVSESALTSRIESARRALGGRRSPAVLDPDRSRSRVPVRRRGDPARRSAGRRPRYPCPQVRADYYGGKERISPGED